MEQATVRRMLFRLIITLKAAMWMVIAAALIIGISDLVRGREAGPPIALLLAIPGLILAQLVAFIAWHRAGGRK
jgi:hypothetical protein